MTRRGRLIKVRDLGRSMLRLPLFPAFSAIGREQFRMGKPFASRETYSVLTSQHDVRSSLHDAAGNGNGSGRICKRGYRAD